MKLGWIDFSKEERNKVLSVINLLSEDGTLDELGIAPVRDGFANLFFPGTSTIQTRAKYFLIVPYVLNDLARSGITNPRVFLEKLDAQERRCGEILTAAAAEGAIGSRTIKSGSWVKRTPADIYWAGIRRYGIFTNGTMSLSEYARVACAMNTQKSNIRRFGSRKDDLGEFDRDDDDAGGLFAASFWNLPTYEKDWTGKLSIELTQTEAYHLRNRIVQTHPDSVMAYILKTGKRELLELDGFESFSGAIRDFPAQMQSDCHMALDFSRFVYMLRIRYNILLTKGKNAEANAEWERHCTQFQQISTIDLEAIFAYLRIVNPPLRQFLSDARAVLRTGDINALDERIYKRECQLKGVGRAKLSRAGEFDDDAWIGGRMLDYRYFNAATILRDIFNAQETPSC